MLIMVLTGADRQEPPARRRHLLARSRPILQVGVSPRMFGMRGGRDRRAVHYFACLAVRTERLCWTCAWLVGLSNPIHVPENVPANTVLETKFLV